MFQEEFEKLTRSDKELFKESVNDLLYQCYIVRKIFDRKTKMFKTNPDYIFLERNLSIVQDYLSYMDMEVNKSDEDGIIYVVSGAERNHLRFDPTTTLIVYVLRSHYEGEIANSPQITEVTMSNRTLQTLVSDMGVSDLSKRISPTTIASALRVLDGFNVVSKNNGTYGDPNYSFFIMPTIRYVISSEKLNALYTMLNSPEESKPESSLFDRSIKEDEK